MKPLKPVIERSAGYGRDEAARDGFSLSALEDLLSDCQSQPEWRSRADIAHAYYDMGKQLTEAQKAKIKRDWGIEPRQTNLIHGVVNGVLGQEAKARTDIRVEADDDEHADVADVFSMRMKEAMREANSDMAVSEAYAGMVKGGIGWVEVSRASDPLDYPYRVTHIHRNEIWYDWRARHLGLNDGRWQVRKRWQDLDEAVALMPEFRQILESAVNGWDLLNLPEDSESSIILQRAWNNERRTRIVRDEWCDTARRRVKFYEVWYRVPAEVVVLQMSPTRRVMYDKANPLHVEAVSRGLVKVSKSITRQIRMALFAGPHRLIDVGTTRRNFPYVPFFAFRDDEDRSPYGLIEGMISPQDEYNERRQMVNWMLKARQIMVDNDALDRTFNTERDLEATAMRPDLFLVLNGKRQNANGVRIGNDLQMQAEQFEVMQDAKQLIQDVPKVFSSQLGNAPAGVTSGIANSLLIEQGIVAMGELNDNYRFGRKLVHEQLLDLIVEDHLDENMQVIVGTGTQRRAIVLNSWDPETGAPLNRVKDAPIRVGLSDVPASPAFRMQEQQQLATIIQGLATNPAALNILAPAYIEGSSLSNRQALADDLRRATGVPTANDRQAQAQAQQQAKQQAALAVELQTADAKATIAKKAADVRLTTAKAIEIETGAQINTRSAALAEHKQLVDEQAQARQRELDQAQQTQQTRQADQQAAGGNVIQEALAEALG